MENDPVRHECETLAKVRKALRGYDYDCRTVEELAAAVMKDWDGTIADLGKVRRELAALRRALALALDEG